MLDLQARLAALTLHVTLEDEVGIVQMAAAARYMAESGKGEVTLLNLTWRARRSQILHSYFHSVRKMVVVALKTVMR